VEAILGRMPLHLTSQNRRGGRWFPRAPGNAVAAAGIAALAILAEPGNPAEIRAGVLRKSN